MVTIQIPKDIREYEPKFMGPFSFRQAVSVALAAGIEFLGYQFQLYVLKLPVASYIPPMFIAFIPLFFGFGEAAFHMKPEVYLRTVFLNMTVIPKFRPYKTHNYYDIHLTEKEEPKESVKKKKKLTNVPEELTAYS